VKDRTSDPVWQAFERKPANPKKPTERQLELRARALADMAAGRFVNVEAERECEAKFQEALARDAEAWRYARD
jgi:hypothetical protein